MIKVELKEFREKIDLDSNKSEIETVFGQLSNDVVDLDSLEFTVDNGGLETLDIILEDRVFKMIFANLTGIDQIFKIVLDLEYTTPNDNTIEASFETSLVIAPGNSGTKSTKNSKNSKEDSAPQCSIEDILKDMGVSEEELEELAQIVESIDTSELTSE